MTAVAQQARVWRTGVLVEGWRRVDLQTTGSKSSVSLLAGMAMARAVVDARAMTGISRVATRATGVRSAGRIRMAKRRQLAPALGAGRSAEAPAPFHALLQRPVPSYSSKYSDVQVEGHSCESGFPDVVSSPLLPTVLKAVEGTFALFAKSTCWVPAFSSIRCARRANTRMCISSRAALGSVYPNCAT